MTETDMLNFVKALAIPTACGSSACWRRNPPPSQKSARIWVFTPRYMPPPWTSFTKWHDLPDEWNLRIGSDAVRKASPVGSSKVSLAPMPPQARFGKRQTAGAGCVSETGWDHPAIPATTRQTQVILDYWSTSSALASITARRSQP